MIASGLDDLRPIWNDLKRRNDWALVSPLEETQFLERAAAERIALGGSQSGETKAHLAITRVYSALLCDRLQTRDERAALELWNFCYRLARRRGWVQEEAEVIAQETIAQLLARLHELETRENLITWVRWLFLGVQKSLVRRQRQETSLPEEDEAAVPLPATTDEASLVEQHVLNQQLLAVLKARLRNPVQLQVVIRWLLLGDKPSDVAHDLGIPLHQARVAKARALKILRDDPGLIQFLVELIGQGGGGALPSEPSPPPPEQPQEGAEDGRAEPK